jgi:hypothetical protein
MMKRALRLLALVPCLAASLTVAGNAQITGLEWNNWSANVPALGSQPAVSAANLTFSATAIDFCEGQTGIGACSPANNNYTLGGFLTSQGGASGVTGVTFQNGGAAGNTLDNTLWEFSGTAVFTTGEVFDVGHDDGTQMYINGVNVLSDPGPTSFALTPFTYTGTTGTFTFNFLYGELDGAPAVYETNLESGGNVPEPGSFVLLGTGLLAAAGAVRRRLSA